MNKFKSEYRRFIEALGYELLVAIILVIVTMLGYIKWQMLALIVGCFTIWPIYELVNALCVKRIKDYEFIQKNNVKMSICMWLIITTFLWICNMITDKSTLWALYPTIGVACWPIMVSIKYFCFKSKL